MKQLIFMSMAALFLMTACETPAPKSPIAIKTEKGEDYTIEYQMDTVRNVKEGYYKIIMSNGVVALEQEYKNDSLFGTEKQYHPSGKLKSEFLIDKGEYNGAFKYYFEDGKTHQEGVHVKGQIDGELKTYYPNGQLKETVMMVGSVEKGPFVQYHENGKLKAKGTFNNGPNSEHCLLEMYKEDASGELEFKKLCRKGTCCTIWSSEDAKPKPANDLCKEILEQMKAECGIEELQ